MSSTALEQRPVPRGTSEYRELKRIVREAGLFESQPGYYRMKAVVTGLLFAVAVAVAVISSNTIVLLVGAAFLGFASTQGALLAHDVGHRQGFRGRRTNAIARYFMGNVLLGVSQSWWNTKHNQHHANPNHSEDDPDVQFPMIVFDTEQLAQRPRWLRPAIAIQAFIFPVLLPFQAINMKISSIRHLFSPGAQRPWLQAGLLGLHFAFYGAVVAFIGDWTTALAFIAVHQATFGVYNSSVFATNHKGMPLTHAGQRWDFLHEQVLTSRNVRSHSFTDFLYGGLNYQIEHHLFPTLPRNHLRKAQALVERFCAEREISYHTTGFLASYGEVFGHLHRVSAPLRQRSDAAV